MGVNFVSMGYVAEALGWEIVVKDGAATLNGVNVDAVDAKTNEPWQRNYTAAELRDLAALFTGAADLLDGGEKEQPKPENELTMEQLEALPVGAVVRDHDGDHWTRTEGRYAWNDNATSDFIYNQYRPIWLVSTPGEQQ